MMPRIAVSSLLLALVATAAQAAPATLPIESTRVADADLLRHVTAALHARKPMDRATKARKIGALFDPRTPRILWYLAEHDRSTHVAVAATGALGELARGGSEVAEDILALLAGAWRHDAAAQAIRELGKLAPSARAFDALLRVGRTSTLPAARRKLAIDALRKNWPARRGELPRLAGPALLPAVVGAAAGGYTLAAVGRWAKADSADVYGWMTGILIGGGTGYLFGREMTLARQTWYASGLTWGVLGGELLARTVVSRPHTRTASSFGVAGELAFAALSYRLADTVDLDEGGVAVANLAATTGLLFGNGLAELGYHAMSSQARNGLVLGTTIGALTAGVAVAPTLKFTRGDAALVAYTTFEGLWFGGPIGDIAHEDLEERRDAFRDSNPGGDPLPDNLAREDPDRVVRDAENAGFMLGPAVGFTVGLILSQHTDLQPSDSAQMLVFGGYGKLLGAGLAMLLDVRSDNGITASHLAGGVVGIAAGAATTDSLHFRDGDLALVPIATMWGFFHGGAIAGYSELVGVDLSGTQRAGIVLTTAAALGIGSMAFAQEYDMTNLQATMGSTGAFWGAWIAGWTSARLHKTVETTMMAAAIGGDLGAVATAQMISPAFDLDPLVLAGASFGGLSLAGLGTLVTAMGTDDGDAMMTANIVGSAAGLVVGGVLARMWLDKRPRRRKPPKARPHSAAVSRDEPEESTFPMFTGAPVMDDGRMVGMSLQLSGSF